MNAGRLRSTIRLVSLTLVDDGQGGYTTEWTTRATVPGEVTRLRGDAERSVGGVITAVARYTVRVRYREDVVPTQILVVDERTTMEIVGVSAESTARRRQLVLSCEAINTEATDAPTTLDRRTHGTPARV